MTECLDDANGQENPDIGELLWALANHGRRLRQCLQDLAEWPDGVIRVQLVTLRDDAYFPLEVMYDYPIPPMDAPLCEERKSCLERGEKSSACTRMYDQKVLCPMGFWAVNKYIERKSERPTEKSTSIQLRLGDPSVRTLIAPIDRLLFAASSKADDFPGSHLRTFEVAEKLNTARITTWST